MLLLLLAGCVSQPQKLQQRCRPDTGTTVTRNVQPVSPDEYARTPEVVRYDRYLLVVTIRRRPSVTLSRKLLIFASNHLHGGCAALRPAPVRLFPVRDRFRQRRALPGIAAVQYQLGRTALQSLPVRRAEVDDVRRVVCHSLRDGYQLPVSQLPPPVSSWSTPAPSAVSQPAISAPQSVHLSAEGF